MTSGALEQPAALTAAGLASATDMVRVRWPAGRLQQVAAAVGAQIQVANGGARAALGVAIVASANRVELRVPTAALSEAQRALVRSVRSTYPGLVATA